MKITYLGTADAGGIPQPFCHCRVCDGARKNGGREIRYRSCYMVNDDLMIDFSSDFLHHAVSHPEIDFTKIKHLLITHSHSDHFYPQDVALRDEFYTFQGGIEKLSVYGNSAVKSSLKTVYNGVKYNGTDIHVVKPGEIFNAKGYRITAVKTDHIPTEDCFIYLIKQDDKQYLHAMDSAEFSESVYMELRHRRSNLDAVTFDFTFGDLKGKFYGHMAIEGCVAVKERLLKENLAREDTRFVLSHVSHVCGKTYEALDKVAKSNGFILAYDGMTIEV